MAIETKIPTTTPEQKRTVGRAGEPLTVDKVTFEVRGRNTGTVFGKGSNLQEALAIQQSVQSGSAPTVSGRPDLLATQQRPGVAVEPFKDTQTGQTITPRVATPAELQQKAGGTLESFNKASGLPVAPAPAAPAELKKFDNINDALKEFTKLGAEKTKSTLLGAPEDYDNQIIRQKASLLTKLFGEDLTPDDLKWLTPSQSSAILSGDEKLIKAELAGLNSIVQSRKDLKKEEEEKALKQYELFAQSGISPDQLPEGFLSQLDATIGLPDGTYKAIYTANYATDQQEKQDALIDSAYKLSTYLQSLPVGETVNIGGVEYASLNKGDIQVFSQDDGLGNFNIISYNKDTGEYSQKTLKGVSSVDGWSTEKDDQGRMWRVNAKTRQMELMYDTSQPNGGGADGSTLKEIFPDGYKPTDADLSALGLTQLNSKTGGIQCGQLERLLTGYEGPDLSSFSAKKALIDKSIGTKDNPPQNGDAFIQAGGSYGHIGSILSSVELPDGSFNLDIIDANRNGDGVIRYSTINSKSVLGFAREGFGFRPELQFGTDSSGVSITGPTFGGVASNTDETTIDGLARAYAGAKTVAEQNQVLTQAKTLGVDSTSVIGASFDVEQPKGIILNTTTGRPADITQTQDEGINGTFGIYKQIDRIASILGESGVTKGSVFGSLNTGVVGGTLKFLTPDNRTEGIFDNLTADLKSRVYLDRSGAAVSVQEAERIARLFPSAFISEAKNLDRVREFTATTLDETASFMRSKGLTISGETIPVRSKTTGEIANIPIEAFDSTKVEPVFSFELK